MACLCWLACLQNPRAHLDGLDGTAGGGHGGEPVEGDGARQVLDEHPEGGGAGGRLALGRDGHRGEGGRGVVLKG